MNAYATQGWESFFVVEAGAAAALAGLLFVAVSINLGRILSIHGLSGRAAEAVASTGSPPASSSPSAPPSSTPGSC